MQKIRLSHEPNLQAKHQAFVYQAEAFNALRDLPYAAVFHEQGLGKTKIAVDLMLYWLEKKVVDTVLIVVKKGLLVNWVRELREHTSITPRIVSQNRHNNFYTFNSPARVMMAHYEAVRSERTRFELFLKTRSVGAILDESVKIKNPESDLAEAFFRLSPLFVRRVIMTGTPVANRPYDLWAQIFFLDRGGSLGNSFRDFKKDYDLEYDTGDEPISRLAFADRLQALNDRISSFSVRATKDSQVISLPEKTIRQVTVDWEPRQFELYRQVRDELRVVVVKYGIPEEDDAEAILKRLLRLVQIASNPKLIDDSYCAIPGKLDPLVALVQEVRRANEKCIVWSCFTENVDWLALELTGFGSCKIHGKLPMEWRTKSVDKFLKDPTCGVLVATPASAKEGLTLTTANHAIFFDRGFSLDDYLQAQDRIHRISQTKRCDVVNLIMNDSIDEWVDVLLHAKRCAAQLVQGDVSREHFDRHMEYRFSDVLRQVLNLRTEEGGSQ